MVSKEGKKYFKGKKKKLQVGFLKPHWYGHAEGYLEM